MTVSVGSQPHPLAPLTSDEFTSASGVVIKSYGPSEPLFFRSVYLHEPTKAELVPFLELEHADKVTPETPRPPRLAAVEYDVIRGEKTDYSRAIVNVTTKEIVSKGVVPRIAPSEPYLTVPEFVQFQGFCEKDPMFIEAMKEFTLPEGFEICIDPWPYGSPDVGTAPPRTLQGLVFARDASKKNPDANHYGFPVPIIPVMDWHTKKIIRVDRLPTGGSDDPLEPAAREDKPKPLFTQAKNADYVPELLEIPLRTDLKPLNVVQPEGASFTIQGDGLIHWQKWRFRLGSTPREGAVLHDICYENRPIAYRLSLSEMTVPYGDARDPFHRKQAFDFGDGGMGRASNSLELGCDCLGAIHYVDTPLVAADGSLDMLKSAICLHEQDNGILWKHTNFRTDRAVVTRNREFVVQFIATLANYEYVFAYKFDLAGSITIETRATGIVSVVGIDYGKMSKYGNVVSPGILAQNHQHIFAIRLDPAIDSYSDDDTQIVVEESRPHKMNPETNPFGNFYDIVREPVQKATWIDLEPRVNRTIKIENSKKKNRISGKNVGYKFVNPPTQMLLADPESRVSLRAPFAQHNIWVTGYREGELYAAGEFTNQSQYDSGGVGDMVKRGDWFGEQATNGNGNSNGNGAESAGGQKSSPVVWGVFGLTHNPRVEDWPVMPVEIHQIHLRPADFFTANPALDVPSVRNQSSVTVACCSKNGSS